MELVGEYVGLEGQRQEVRVLCEAPDDTDPIQGLLYGVAQMRELVAGLFGPVVQRNAKNQVAATSDEDSDEASDEASDGDNEDDAEDENNIDNRTNSDGPSAKRSKPPC